MKRIHWFTLLGLPAAGLAALLLGQAVWGQGQKGDTVPAPIVLPQPGGDSGEGETSPLPEAPVLPAPPPGQRATPPLPMPDLGPIPKPNETSPLAPPSLPKLPPATTGDVLPAATTPSAPVFRDDRTPGKLPASSAPHVPLDVQPGAQNPAVTVEWIGPTSVRINHPLNCQLVVKNTSSAVVHNVVVRYRLPQGLKCKAAEPTAVHDAGEYVWHLGTLGPQHFRRIELSLVAHTRGVINSPATVTFTSVASHRIQVREPQLAVKVTSPDKVVGGEKVTLLVAISNPGDGAAEGVKLKAMLPDGLEHPRGKMVEFDAGGIAAGETRAVQLVCIAKGSGTQMCAILATADGNLSAKDTARVDILMPKLAVAMNGPKMRYLERHAIYVLKVANPGNAPAKDVEVQKLIPAGFKFHQANHGGQYQESSRTVSWKLGDVGPGQIKEIAVDLIPIEAGDHRIVAHAKALQGLRSEADLRTVVEGLPSLFFEVGHVDDPIEVGADTAYEIRIANNGTKSETNIELVCTLPDQLEFRDAKCSTTLRYRLEGRKLIFETLPRLAPKADVIFRVQARGMAPGDVRFQMRIRADGLKDPVQREEGTRIYSDGSTARSGIMPPATPTQKLPAASGLPAPRPETGAPRPGPGALPAPVLPSPVTPSALPSSSAPLPAPPALPMPGALNGTNP